MALTRYWLYPPAGTPPYIVNGHIEGRRKRRLVVPLFTGLPTPAMRAWIARGDEWQSSRKGRFQSMGLPPH